MSDDPFVKHGEKLGGSSVEGRFVSIGDGPKQIPSVEGLLLGREESSKYPGNLVYTFATKEEILKVGGNKFLNDKVKEDGALYRITYVGLQRGKSGRNYKTFDVFTVPAAEVVAGGYDKLYKSPDAAGADGVEEDADLPF